LNLLSLELAPQSDVEVRKKIIESFQEGFDTLFDQQIENDADIQRPRRKDSVLPIVAKYDFSLLLL